MRYRTIIELVCDASDSEDASNIAGDYLKGEIDFGVEMRCKTTSLWAHRMRRYTASCAAVFLVLSTLLLKVGPVENADGTKSGMRMGLKNTSTVIPVLKTKHKNDFKEDWDKKKHEAMVDYLKK
ncbi:MAG: hypothetical protein KAI70_00150 [Candidatus Omnitrophica bacterium]|nr:hypothetical protein [Candidatus Omnitrophota bacterium]